MSDKYSVLQVLPELESGGVERGTIDIAKAIVDSGNKAYVCSNGGKLVKRLEEVGAQHIKLPVHSKNPITIILNIFRLKRLIKALDIDIVHARSRAPAWSSFFACRLTKTKFITTFHGAYESSHTLKRFYNSVMLRGNIVIAVSNFILKYIETRYRMKPDNIVVIHRGVDLDAFDNESVSKTRISELKSKLGITIKGTVIVFPARITRIKGHLLFLNSLRYLKQKNFTCIIVGNVTPKHIEYLQEIEDTIKSYGLSDKVFVRQTVTDMPALYSMSDIVVCPSIVAEAFGRTIIEAQAMDRIVIASRLGAPVEIIQNGVTGFLVSHTDPSEMTEALEKVMTMKDDEKAKIIKAAKTLLKKEFSLKKMCDSTLKIYKALLKK